MRRLCRSKVCIVVATLTYTHTRTCCLVSRGARIDKHDKDNFTPLLIAACNGHADTIHTLLDLGARIEDVDKNDKSALYWAAEEDNVVALKVRPSVDVAPDACACRLVLRHVWQQ